MNFVDSTAPVRTPDVNQAFSLLDGARERLEGSLELLIKRLEPILGPTLDGDSKGNSRPTAAYGGRCKVSSGLYNVIAHLENMTQMIELVSETVEV